MRKIRPVGSAEHAKDSVKTTAGRPIGETRRNSIGKTHGLWARIQNVFGSVIETLRGK